MHAPLALAPRSIRRWYHLLLSVRQLSRQIRSRW